MIEYMRKRIQPGALVAAVILGVLDWFLGALLFGNLWFFFDEWAPPSGVPCFILLLMLWIGLVIVFLGALCTGFGFDKEA